MKEEATHDQSGTLRFSRLPARPPPPPWPPLTPPKILFSFALKKNVFFVHYSNETHFFNMLF